MNQLLTEATNQFHDTSYPRQIQGDLRIILQIKDLFLRAYKLLEEYRRLVDEQIDFLTRDFIEDKILLGENEIMQLKLEVRSFEMQARQKVYQNEGLCQYLISMDYGNVDPTTPIRMLYCRSPIMRARTKYKYQHTESNRPENARDSLAETVKAIIEIQKDIRIKAHSLLDFYHDIFTLQLHFILILTQICSYCMPLITESIGLLDRIFFWSFRPEIDLVRRNADVTDRLKDIYTSVQYLLNTLGDTVMFLKQKITAQKALEKTFNQKVNEQQAEKDRLLRIIHSIRQDLDLMDEENDRLVGLIVKSNPDFVTSEAFQHIAESVPRSILCDYLDKDELEDRLRSPPIPKYTYNPKRYESRTQGQSSRPPSSLKDKLMGRTKAMFDAAIKKMDDPEVQLPRNIQTFHGGIVAELSEITSESNKEGKSRGKEKGKNTNASFSRDNCSSSNQLEELQIRTLASIGEDLCHKLDSNRLQLKKKSKKKGRDRYGETCTIEGSGRMEPIFSPNETDSAEI